MSIEQILQSMDEMLDKSWGLPLTGGRSMVDADKLRDLIDDIKINLPAEIRQAKSIVSDRTEILEAAKREGEALIRKAEERSKSIISHEEIVRAAQARASDIITQAQVKAREIRQAAHDFSDDTLKDAEESLTKSLLDIRSARQALRGGKKK